MNKLISKTKGIINAIIEDKELKEEISFCFYNLIIKYVNPSVRTMQLCCISWIMLAVKMRQSKLSEFDWKFMCEIYNANFAEILSNNLEIFANTDLDRLATKIKMSYEKEESAIGWFQYHTAVSCMFFHLACSSYVDKYLGLAQLNKHKELLGCVNTVVITNLNSNKEREFIKNYIMTNYPLDSNIDEMMQVEYIDHLNTTSIRKTNVNIRTRNHLIYEILNGFLKCYSDDAQVTFFTFRVFIYYFSESLGDYSICSYADFNERTCIRQIYFYKKLKEDYLGKGIKINRRSDFTYLVIYFYRYLVELFENKGVFNNINSAFRTLLDRRHCLKVLSAGYVPLFYNRNELPPKVDKFCIIPTEYTMNNSASENTTMRLIDMRKVCSKYRDDVIEYLWYAEGQIMDKASDIAYLFEFLNYKLEFDEYTSKVININKSTEKEFSEEFLVEYRMYIESRIANLSTIKSVFKPIRKYLKYFSEKYKVNSIELQVLSLARLNGEIGGKPITNNDLKVIYDEFLRRESVTEIGRLYTIVFEIFINTNLRIGEILNLKRNCLTSNNINCETAMLSYFSKTSHQEVIQQEVNIKIIRLIEEAIQLTEQFKDTTMMSEYIFIRPIKRKVLFRSKRISFYCWCKDIFKSVENELEIKDYKPYNIRHTFIHNAYEEGIKEGYTIYEITAVTGNSFKTAVRSYRNLNKIDSYVEAFSKVIISDVDVNGKILLSDNVKSTNMVRGNLGRCANDKCTFDIAECLICKNFVTFINRIPVFESKIDNLNKKLEVERNQLEIEYINAEKKMLAKYLSELYKFKSSMEK